MPQSDFYTPSYFGNSHSVPTTDNWFDDPPIGASQPIVPADAPVRPIAITAGLEDGWTPPGAIRVPWPAPGED